MDTGHWHVDFEFNPNEWFGFIYRIIELHTGREYIGKKQFTKLRRKVVNGRKNRKHVITESDWKSYTGSSDQLNSSIQANGIENYLFIIESLHKSKGSLHYEEVRKQIVEDVLRAVLPDGVTRKYFNRHIAAIKFLPPAEHTEETKKKMRKWWYELSSAEKEEWCNKYVRGDNQPSKRSMDPEQYQLWLDRYFRGPNNPMYGKVPHNKGKTFEELYGKETAIKMREHLAGIPKKTGEDHPLFGKERSPEIREKISKGNKGKQAGEKNPMFGKPCFFNMTDDEISTWKANISHATRGKKKSQAMKEKLSATTKGVPKNKITCPHCHKIGGEGNMKRYHFDNCKAFKNYTAGE
jgi:Putative endonuclease segE, GIY-YIG domain/NUMOD3 motif